MPDHNETGDLSRSRSTDRDPNKTSDHDSSSLARPSNVAAFAESVSALGGSGAALRESTHSSESAREALPTDKIPGYELLQELGRGGMGVVYRARDIRLNREVALKMILRADTNRVAIARFWAEAEVMAAVKHPHVVQVFELGEHDGRPFMAMELVTGGSLAERIKSIGAFAPKAAAVLVEKIARGVAAAHDLGIVHRDLKPGNVLVTPDDTPKVTDFGLAKRQANDLTASQAVMGTPAYMAPEQAAGRAKFVGPPADVWALGVVLYECLAGTRPFQGDTVATLLSQIQSAEPPALRSVVRAVPRDLEVIAAKCLAKEPEHRYHTAGELADDLGRFVRGETISARPVSRIEGFARWVRRKPTTAAAYGFSGLAVLLAAVSLVIFSFWRDAEEARKLADAAKGDAINQQGIAEKAKDEAELLRDIARGAEKDALAARDTAKSALKGEEAAKKEVERQKETIARINYGRTIQVAYQAWKDNKLAEARKLLASTRQDLRGWEYDHVHRLCYADLLTLEGHANPIGTASWDSTGSRIVTADTEATRVWDSTSGKLLHELKCGKALAVWLHPEGCRVVVAGPKWKTQVWEVTSQKLLYDFPEPVTGIHSASFTRDGTKLVTSFGQVAMVRDAKSGKLLHELKGHAEIVLAMSVSADGNMVATSGAEKTVRVWDATQGKLLHEFKGHAFANGSGPFSPDGTKIATTAVGGSEYGSVWISDPATGKPLQELKNHFVHSRVFFSPNGSSLAIVYGRAIIYEFATGRQHTIEVTGETFRSATFSPDGSRIATQSDGRSAWVWDAADGFLTPLELKGHASALSSSPVSFSPDGTRIITPGTDGTARVWNTGQDHQQLEFFQKVRWPIYDWAAINPAGTKIATLHDDRIARIWNLGTAQVIHQLKGHTGELYAAKFSPDGTQFVTTSTDKTARLWDAITGEFIREFKGHTGVVHAAEFSPDGNKLATGSADRTARVWDIATGQPIAEFPGHTSIVHGVSFSPDGSKVITGDGSAIVRLWHVATGTLIYELKGELRGRATVPWFKPTGTQVGIVIWDLECLWDVATGQLLRQRPGRTITIFSPDGKKKIRGGDMFTVQVWDVTTEMLLHELRVSSPVTPVAFSPDGSRILTGDSDAARIWDTESGVEVLAFPGKSFVAFTLDGSRLLVNERNKPWSLYDSRPVNQAFIRPPLAPMPRDASR